MVHQKTYQNVLEAKSYTSLYDIFGRNPFQNFLYRNPYKTNAAVSVFQGDGGQKTSENLSQRKLVTSESYYFLNKDISYGSVRRSTSSLFYDLDEYTKRESFRRLIPEIRICMKDMHGFKTKSNVIVQECATEMRSKIKHQDSVQVNSKKVKRNKKIPNAILSSEIFLRDNDHDDGPNKYRYFDKDITDYAKYQTELTNPITKVKKCKKKDRSKPPEDPCPCQLFSYACPCNTDEKKSLTELANRSLVVNEQITSTIQIHPDNSQDSKSHKKQKKDQMKETKDTNTSFEKNTACETVNELEAVVGNDEVDDKEFGVRSKVKSSRRSRQIICPKCKEKVEILSSSEEVSTLNSFFNNNSPNLPSKAAFAYRTSTSTKKGKQKDDADLCCHEPRCELIPACQVTSEGLASGSTKKNTIKSHPRVIRLTKACRHHPPCTVVPSCQRLNVLQNHCEFVPPCLHRPRCVNLPLCIPISQHYNIGDINMEYQDKSEYREYANIPIYNYPTMHQNARDGIFMNMQPDPNTMQANPYDNYSYEVTPQTQNAFANYYELLKPETTCYSTSATFRQIIPNNCDCSKSTKECQYDCTDCKCNDSVVNSTSDDVVYIRDVGCQFRNKTQGPLIQSKISSTSFEDKPRHVVTQVHTKRYEEKFTSPVHQSSGEPFLASDTVSSTEIDSHFPSPSYKMGNSVDQRKTGFSSTYTTPYIAAFAATHAEDTVTSTVYSNTDGCSEDDGHQHQRVMYPSKFYCRKSFSKGKFKRIYTVKKRKHSKSSNHVPISD